MTTSRRFKALSWNIRANCGASSHRLIRIADAIARTKSDAVLLQEVSSEGTAMRLQEHLRARGFIGWHFSGASRGDLRYGNVIASRDPLRAIPWRLPMPQLMARAAVDTPAGSLELVSVHIPNGSKYSWKKIEMFEALGALLATDHRTPRVVGGDFNEPRKFLGDDTVLSFGADEDGVVRGYWDGHPNHRWQNAVDNVIGPRAPLRHAWLAKNPGRSQTTHVSRGVRQCFFDHLLASRDHFRVIDCGYHHRWRTGTSAPSDHSAAWATFQRV